MKRSINEIQGMVLKAARGAGVPLGVGEDLSRAVPYFIENNSLDCLVDLIAQGCTEAQAAIDSLAGAQTADLPDDIPTDAMICLAAAQGICAEVSGGALRVASNAPMQPATGPQEVPDALWSKLENWAAKTYVPSSEASRAAGAGAGLTDND